jgi:hypothetical protein
MRATCFSLISLFEKKWATDTTHVFTQYTAYVLHLHVVSKLLAQNFIFFLSKNDVSDTGFCFCLLVESKSKSHYNRMSVGLFVLVSCPFWSWWPGVTFIWVTITFFIFHVGRPLWREDGSVICSAMTQVQVTLRPVCRPVRLGAGPPMGPITRF